MHILQSLSKKGLIKPPPFVAGGTQYETIMGSMAYGVAGESSDWDIYGFCIPPKDMVFPHLSGEILGFGNQKKRFEQYQQHHIKDPSNGREYDLNIYNIVKYFHLCMENNPNMIDSLFTPEMCVQHATKIANHVRDNRKKFLHKGAWHTFKGYSFSQMHKMRIKTPDPDSVRYESVVKHGFDVKFAYHVVRLMNEVEQILIEGDLDLTRNSEELKSIRRGEWTIDQIEARFMQKQSSLEEAYVNSKLPHKPDEESIKTILLECLEEHYGSLDGAIESTDHYKNLIRQVQQLLSKV
jgi:predicted nucleotidyltransferase